MKKKKTLIICIFLIICVIINIFIIIHLYKNRKLSGEKIIDGLYLYNLDTTDYNSAVSIIDNNIYYYIEKDNTYKFYRINIYNNKKEYLGEYNSEDSYCFFDRNYIECANNDGKTIYNSKFKVVYKGDDRFVIPYKNSYYKIENNTIYYDNKEYKKIKKDLTDYNMYQYNIFDKNMYIFFLNELDRCIYNVSKEACEDYEYSDLKEYKDGYYYITEDKLYIDNKIKNELKEYDNPVKGRYLTISAFNDNKLHYFSEEYYRVYDLENNQISLLNHRFSKYLYNMYLEDNLLYLIESDKVYIIKLDEIKYDKVFYSETELNTEIDNMINDRIDKIESEYDIDIKIKDEANLKFTTLKEKMTGEQSNENINDSLDDLEELTSLFGKEFFKEFKHGEYTGLSVYIVSKIEANFSMAGQQFRYYDKYAVISDTTDFKRTMCHELMHALEDASKTKGSNIFNKWSSYNPKGYKYVENYNEYDTPYKYSALNDEYDVYFIDNYAQNDELEDKARIFENICMNTTSVIEENEYLLKKAKYLVKEIKKYYPMLEKSPLFDKIK